MAKRLELQRPPVAHGATLSKTKSENDFDETASVGGASIGSGRLGRLSSGGFDSVRSASVASFGSVRLGSPSQRGRADRPQHRFPPSRTNGWRKRVCRRGHGCFAVVLIRMTSSEPMIL